MMTEKITKSVFIFLTGLAIAGMAGFAGMIGLDKTPENWGRIRLAIFVFGIFVMACSIFYYRFADRFIQTGFFSAIKTSAFYRYSFILPIFIVVVLIYVWFVSSGTWTAWNSPTRYYAALAQGFRYGNLFIPTRPNPLLAELKDPYEPANWRGKVEVPMDISYYEGRYYLYWGPTPAVILYALQPYYSGRIGDLFLVFGFVCGIFLFQIFILVLIWERFFRGLPLWILKLSIWVVGLAGPVTFMLGNFKGARIYEAAVTGGQFFLVAGLLLVLTEKNKSISSWRLVFIGILSAFAVGARLTLVFPIGFLMLMCAFRIFKTNEGWLVKITKLILLGFPLALGIAALGWYNWARFGSVTESGLYYQLTGGFNIQKHYGELVNLKYILQNIFNYVFYPFKVEMQFPFFFPRYAYSVPLFSFYTLPDFYSGQWLTGILWTAPFIVFAIVPLANLLSIFRKRFGTDANDDQKNALNWILNVLIGVALLGFVFLLAFFWSAMRYLYDFVPALILLGAIGFWQGYQQLTERKKSTKLYSGIGIALTVFSIINSTLLAISVNDARFPIIDVLSHLTK